MKSAVRKEKGMKHVSTNEEEKNPGRNLKKSVVKDNYRSRKSIMSQSHYGSKKGQTETKNITHFPYIMMLLQKSYCVCRKQEK